VRFYRMLPLAAVLALGLFAHGASARQLSLSSSSFRATWEHLEFRNNIEAGAVICDATLEGTFHSRVLVKTFVTLIGYVTRAIVNACGGGSAVALPETLPWHLYYDSFNGTLPNITDVAIGVVGASFKITNGTMECLERTSVGEPVRLAAEVLRGRIGSFTPNEPDLIRLTGGFCGIARGFLRGTSRTVTVLGGTTIITVALI
jgi:hypothetical protein